MLKGYWRDGKARQTNNGATPLRYTAVCHLSPPHPDFCSAESFAFSPVLVDPWAPMAVVIAGFFIKALAWIFLLLLPASKLHTAGEEVGQSIHNYRARARVNIKPLV